MKLIILFVLALLAVAVARPIFGVIKYDSDTQDEGPKPDRRLPTSSSSSESKESSEETSTVGIESTAERSQEEFSIETSSVEGVEEGSGELELVVEPTEILS